MSKPPFLVPGPDWTLNACLNYGVDHWFLYTDGYRRAAETLTEHVRSTRGDLDALIFPVLFLWRHHLELKLKSLTREAAKLLGRHWQLSGTHDLSALLAESRTLFDDCFREFGEKVPGDKLSNAQKSFKELKQIDIQAMAFKYPEDLSSNPHLQGVTHINYQVVSDYFQSVADDLDYIEVAFGAFWDWQQEMLSAY